MKRVHALCHICVSGRRLPLLRPITCNMSGSLAGPRTIGRALVCCPRVKRQHDKRWGMTPWTTSSAGSDGGCGLNQCRRICERRHRTPEVTEDGEVDMVQRWACRRRSSPQERRRRHRSSAAPPFASGDVADEPPQMDTEVGVRGTVTASMYYDCDACV